MNRRDRIAEEIAATVEPMKLMGAASKWLRLLLWSLGLRRIGWVRGSSSNACTRDRTMARCSCQENRPQQQAHEASGFSGRKEDGKK
jgi:hypothetical protein